MSTQPKKRARKVPATIREKTDRDIMETLFGKRVMKRVDTELAEYEGRGKDSMNER